MSIFIITMGVSGCGKTTIGRMISAALDVPYYEGDDYHPKENVDKMSLGIPLNDEDRDGWLQRLSDLILEKLTNGESGVLSCSALKQKYRGRLTVDPDKVHFIYLKGSDELIRARMEKRTNHYMPAGLLKSQYEALEEPEDIFTVSIDQSPENILLESLSYIKKLGD